MSNRSPCPRSPPEGKSGQTSSQRGALFICVVLFYCSSRCRERCSSRCCSLHVKDLGYVRRVLDEVCVGRVVFSVRPAPHSLSLSLGFHTECPLRDAKTMDNLPLYGQPCLVQIYGAPRNGETNKGGTTFKDPWPLQGHSLFNHECPSSGDDFCTLFHTCRTCTLWLIVSFKPVVTLPRLPYLHIVVKLFRFGRKKRTTGNDWMKTLTEQRGWRRASESTSARG